MRKYIKSYTADDLKAQLGDNYPKGGYLYILKHGIGPGTIPRDVTVVKTKDLPNYYTAVWLDRFLSADELKEYDIPSETDINKYLGRINYCQKNGDVVPCDDVEACDDIKATTDTSSIVNTIYSVMMDYEYGYDPDMTDINTMLQELTNKGVHVDTSDAFKKAWVSAHNKAERKTWGSSGDSYRYDSLTPGELDAIENYDTEYWEYVKDHPFKLKPASVTSSTSVKAATKTPKFETLRDEDGVYGYKLGNWYLMKIYSWGNSYTWYIFDEPHISLFEYEKSKYGYVGDGNEQGYVHNLKEGKQILIDRYLTENCENDVQACDQVTASMSVDTSTLEPRQRTAIDGKTWWVVFDTATGKYSTYTCFGKYKTKKDCQYAIDHCEYSRDINSATEPNAPDAKKSKLVREIIKRAKEVRDYFQYHNNNLNRRQEQILDDLSDGIDSESIYAIREAIENLKYNSKNMRSGQYELVIDLYDDFNLANGKYEGMGYPEADDVDACDTITGSINADYGKDMIKFFYKHKFLGACDPEDIYCEAVYDLMKSDKNAASQILHYMNHLGDPVFPVSEEDWGTPETNVDNVDLWELYSTFMQELDYEYNDDKDMGYDFSVYPDFQPWDFEIFEGEVAEENVVTGSTKPRYMANMVSASSSDSAYDENDELYKYYVAGYYSVDSNGHPYGLAESLYTNDFDEALETAHTYCGNGDYIEFTNQITGMSLDYDPDDWEEATSYGEYPTSVYDLY